MEELSQEEVEKGKNIIGSLYIYIFFYFYMIAFYHFIFDQPSIIIYTDAVNELRRRFSQVRRRGLESAVQQQEQRRRDERRRASEQRRRSAIQGTVARRRIHELTRIWNS